MYVKVRSTVNFVKIWEMKGQKGKIGARCRRGKEAVMKEKSESKGTRIVIGDDTG